MCGWIALGGWLVLLLAIWCDGYVASKLRRSPQQAAGDVSADTDTTAATTDGEPTQGVASKKRVHVQSKKTQ